MELNNLIKLYTVFQKTKQ